jgi:hypothetical protein
MHAWTKAYAHTLHILKFPAKFDVMFLGSLFASIEECVPTLEAMCTL